MKLGIAILFFVVLLILGSSLIGLVGLAFVCLYASKQIAASGWSLSNGSANKVTARESRV
jgi:hypothetical protein